MDGLRENLKMTNYFYSGKNNSFIAAGSPLLKMDAFSDAIAINDDVFIEFFNAENDGQRRISGANGLPEWEVIPPLSSDEIHAKAVRNAEIHKARLLAEASEATRELQTDLLLDIIDDEGRAKLIDWRKYIKTLDIVDLSTAPDVTWPAKPL